MTMLSRYGKQQNFSDDEIIEKIDDFEDRVKGRFLNAPTTRLLLGIGIAGLCVIPCGLPGAIAVASPLLINAVKNAVKNGSNAAYVEKTGLFYHLLSSRELAELSRYTGVEWISQQITRAYCEGQKLSGAAKRFVIQVEGELTPTTIEAAVKYLKEPEQEGVPMPTDPDELPTPIQEAATLPTQSIGQNTRLNAIPVASEPARSRQWDDDEQLSKSSDRHEWMQDLLSYPSVLIWGAPGAGKSTFAEWLVKERVKLDHKLEILDPHRQYGQWDGLDVFGDGMDYAGIDDRLKEFADLVESRYLARSKRPDFNPRPLTVLAEEFTQWSKKCPHAPAFFEMSVSDIRKINCHVVYVSHNRTLSALGGAKGLAATRDSALLELELLAKVDDATGKAVPAMRGMLKYPGRAPIEVAIPDFSNPAPPQNQGTPLSSVLLNTIRGDGSGKK